MSKEEANSNPYPAQSGAVEPTADADKDYEWQPLVRALGDGTWAWDLTSGDVEFDPQWVASMGYTIDELQTYEQWAALVEKSDLPQLSAEMNACLKGETERYECEFRMRHRDGRYVWVRSRAYVPLRAETGEPLRMVGLYESIEERKRTEQQLRDAEARWSFALEGAGDGVWDWDLVSGEVYFSRQWKTMLGFTEAEITNNIEQWRRLAVPEDLVQSDEEIGRYIAGEVDEYSCECRARCKDGSIKWILDRGKFVEWDEHGKPTRMIGTHQDITADKERAEALRRNHAQLERVTSLVPGIVFEYEVSNDGRSHFPYVSTAVESIFSVTRDAAATDAAALFEAIVPEDRERVRESVMRAVHAHKEWKDAYRVQVPGQAPRWLFGHTVPDPESSSQDSIRSYGYITDITEQKQAANLLEQQRHELTIKNKELEEFAYIASHDLQEPLRKIQAFSDRLQRRVGADLGEPESRDLEKVIDAATRMRALIDALLDLSRVTYELADFVRVSMNDVVRSVCSDLEVQIGAAGALIEVADLPDVWGNRVLLGRLLQNLIQNAIKFRHEDREPQIVVGIKNGNDDADTRVTLTVADNGIGIENKYLELVFTPLQRLHSRDRYEGTGIGLAVCRKIVTAHDGTIRVKRATGGGSVFEFDLKAARD